MIMLLSLVNGSQCLLVPLIKEFNAYVAFILNESQYVLISWGKNNWMEAMFIASIMEWKSMICCLLSLMNESHCYIAFIIGWKPMLVSSIIELKPMICCLIPLMNESHCYVTFIIG
jgi:hypothetical protein